MPGNTTINLVRSRKNHFWDNFMKWALTTGRFLIIVTETVALAAFVYRFTLDREIIDLADSIKHNQTIVSFYQTDEARFRNLQERIVYAEQLTTPEDGKTALLKQFVSQARGKVTFQAIELEGSTVHIEATTSSTAALSSFLSGIQSLKAVKSVSVDRVENRTTTGQIVFTMTAQLISQGGKGETPDESN